jgi:cytochrome bd-type quinol oxidase subunit 2
MSDTDLRHDLLERIEARRAAVGVYLRQQRPRTRRLATATIVLSSLAAVFTAGPAVGGESFSGGVQRTLGLSSDSFVWRALCLAALLVSVGAALLTNVGRSQEAVARLSTAEAASAELEGLATLVQFGQIPLEDAVKLYQDYTVKIPFVEDAPVLAGR